MYKCFKINILTCILMLSLIYSVVFADDDTDTEIAEEKARILQQEKDHIIRMKNECIRIRTTPSSKLYKYSIYFNSIADYLLNNNRDILNKYKLNVEHFCIIPDEGTDLSHIGYGLISINPYLISSELIKKDAIIAGFISHELAHDILGHHEAKSDKLAGLKARNRIKSLTLSSDSVSEDAEDTTSLEYKEYKELLKVHEIEADNLGFKLYLKAGFKPTIYRDNYFLRTIPKSSFPSKKENSLFEDLSDEDFKLFKLTFTRKGCISEGNKTAYKIKSDYGFFNRKVFMNSTFMNTIKYYPITVADPHPTDCWRFWNIHTQLWWNKDEESLRYRLQNNRVNLVNLSFIRIKRAIEHNF